MIVTDRIEAGRQLRWAAPTLSWGLVPTMGYLHLGHLSLVRRARADNDRVAVSVFVNPTQFAPGEDLAVYPRDLAGDLKQLKEERVDLVFVPDEEEMYASGFQTSIEVTEVSTKLEGISRPTHFQGVTTVVAKLFNIFEPTRAYFGQKDAQQAVVVRRMVRDLDFNLEVVVCPIIRENDGLAMSSRNQYLSVAERRQAPGLFETLQHVRERLLRNGVDATDLEQEAIMQLEKKGFVPDYVAIRHSETLLEPKTPTDPLVILAAVRLGNTRLIDNLKV